MALFLDIFGYLSVVLRGLTLNDAADQLRGMT